MRAIAVAHMTDSPEDFKPFVTDEAWETYLARMGHTSEWGDHLTLQAVSAGCMSFVLPHAPSRRLQPS